MKNAATGNSGKLRAEWARKKVFVVSFSILPASTALCQVNLTASKFAIAIHGGIEYHKG